MEMKLLHIRSLYQPADSDALRSSIMSFCTGTRFDMQKFDRNKKIYKTLNVCNLLPVSLNLSSPELLVLVFVIVFSIIYVVLLAFYFFSWQQVFAIKSQTVFEINNQYSFKSSSHQKMRNQKYINQLA